MNERTRHDLVDILREASRIIQAIPSEHAPANMRFPIVDELDGFAGMLEAYESMTHATPEQSPAQHHFEQELFESFESFETLAGEHGLTEANAVTQFYGALLYLSGAQRPGGNGVDLDVYDEPVRRALLEVIDALPSAAYWRDHLLYAEAASVPGDRHKAG